MMRYVQAAIALGLFGGLGYGVYTQTLLLGADGDSGSRASEGLVNAAIDQFGHTNTAIGLVALGLVLAAVFLVRHERA